MKFNINNYVKVRLTDEGRKIVKKSKGFYKVLGGDYSEVEITEDLEGWSLWQMWDLMSTFGAYMFNGCRTPFETEIDIIEDNKDAYLVVEKFDE